MDRQRPDWRAIVREHAPDLEPGVEDELAQHLADLYAQALVDGHRHDEALATARTALPAQRDRLARDIASARRALPGLSADRWGAASVPDTSAKAAILRDVRRDVIYGIRALLRAPGYTAIALITLAVGIGANSAIFAAVDTVLLRPMPYANADRLVVPVSIHAARGIDTGSVSFADYADWQRESEVFEAVALWRPITVDLTGTGQPERVRGVQVSGEYFRVISVMPIAGRTLVAADQEAQAARVALISHGLWQRVFGGAADTVGRTVRIGGVAHEVVGVLPPRVVWPDNAALFVPMRSSLMSEDVRTRRDNLVFGAVALLRAGVDIDRGNAVLRTIAARIEREHPASRAGWTNGLQPLREFMVPSNVRRALWVLLGAVGAVLLIGCANLAHLGLVRGLGRAREFGVRIALGASRWRLVRQLAVECLILAAVGAVAGAALATWLIEGLAAMAPADTPFVDQLRLDVRVLAATGLLTMAATIVAGLLPAIASSRVAPAPALKDGSPAAGSSRRVRALRHILIVAEVAGTVVLLTGAALLLRSFSRLQRVDPGLDVDRVMMARLALPRTPQYSTPEKSAQFFQRLTERLAATPGIESAAATSFVPVGGGGFGLGRVFLAEGRPEPPAGPDVSAQWNVVTPEYFRTVGIPILRGRSFTPDDRSDSTPVVVVSRSFARRMFGDDEAIGRRVRSWRDENTLREIVGVVDEVRYTGLAERDVSRQVYIPHTQDSWGLMNVVVRSATQTPAGLEEVVRREVAALDPELAVSNVATLRDVASDSVASERYTTLLLSLLAATALGLGAIGIYGVISHAVSMRRRELGVRAALGAPAGHLYSIVLRQGLRLTVLGLAIGLTGSLVVSRALRTLLYETESHDPIAYGVSVGMIVVAAGLACFGPARRAARIDPLTALRAE